MLRQRAAVPYLAAALAGGVLALAAIVVAPATANRVGTSPADLWLALSAAIATAAYQVARLVRYFPYFVALCLLAPAAVRTLGHGFAIDLRGRALAVVTGAASVTLVFCYFPSFYASNGNPPARALIVPGFIIVAYLVYLGWAIEARARALVEPRRLAYALTAVLAIVPLAVAFTILPQRARIKPISTSAPRATLGRAR
jgi:hypothetical protein